MPYIVWHKQHPVSSNRDKYSQILFCHDIHHMGIKNKTKQNKNNDTPGTDSNNQIWKKLMNNYNYYILSYFFYSQIHWIVLHVCKLRMGFSVPSIIWVGAELMLITIQRTRPAWPTKTKLRMTLDCSRIAKEIVMMGSIFVEGRRQILLNSFKRQE